MTSTYQLPADPQQFRKALGSFVTGVTVITTMSAEGHPRGFTANSFASVSLDPPLLLICIGKSAASYEIFSNCRGFAINILSATQRDVSNVFAAKRADKFDTIEWCQGKTQSPILTGTAAWFDCWNFDLIDAGDHVILIGKVEAFDFNEESPLVFGRGGYIDLRHGPRASWDDTDIAWCDDRILQWG